MIFCLSQLHTGTWSTIAWLVLHKEVNGLMLSTDVYDVVDGKRTIPQMQDSGTYHQKFDPSMVYHEHIRPDHWFEKEMSRTQIVLATTNPTVIPIRDPLLSLISYQNRAEIHDKVGTSGFMPVEHILDRWVLLAEKFDTLRQYDHIQFLCWDLLGKNGSDRLWEVTKNLGMNDQSACLVGQAMMNNSMGDYALKFDYVKRDADAMRDGVDGVHGLMKREKILRPFMECLGYSDLMWWS